MKKFLRLLILSCALAVAAVPLVVVLSPHTPVDAQITPIDEEPNDAPGLGSIIGSPEAGPKPEDAGDRGGYAQLGLAIVLVVGVGFIASRVVRDAKNSSPSTPATNPSTTPSDPSTL